MAPRKQDNPQNKGFTGFISKNFGKATNKNSLGTSLFEGAFRPYFGPVIDEDCALVTVSFIATMAALGFGSYNIAHNMDENFDFNPRYETVETVGPSQVYNFEENNYLLRQTDEGVQLYRQSNTDDSLTDDVFVLLDRHAAPTIARNIGEVYKGIVEQQQGVINIWSEFETVREDEPIVMQYEGISGVFEDTANDLYYVIADNVDTASNEAWEPSAESAQAGYDVWTRALTDMASNNYISNVENTTEGIDLNDMNTSGLASFMTLIGMMSGLGVAGGGVAHVMSSRRRYKRDMGLR